MKRFFAGFLLLCLLSIPASVAIWAQTQHSATVSWTYTQGTDLAVGFNVYRSNTVGGTYSQINTTLIPVSTLTFVDNVVTAGSTYFYVVDAQDANGIHSAQSAPVSGVIPGNPNLPTGVTVTTK
jgi:fibronectin type 3 domain-containing protein